MTDGERATQHRVIASFEDVTVVLGPLYALEKLWKVLSRSELVGDLVAVARVQTAPTRSIPTANRRFNVGAVVVHEFMTLDGVIDNPAWSMEYGFDPKMGEAIARIMGSSKSLLMGRNTYELFAPTWSTRTAADDPGAPFMNESPKHVVSSTLKNPEWSNSTVIGAYDPDTIRALKERTDGDIYVSGSGTLVRAMLGDGLIDELHLFVYPLALGTGRRLFPDGLNAKFTRTASEAYDNGAIHLAYQPSK